MTIEPNRQWRILTAPVLAAMVVAFIVVAANSDSEHPLHNTALASLQRRLVTRNAFGRLRLGESRGREHMIRSADNMTALEAEYSEDTGRNNFENSKRPFDSSKPNPIGNSSTTPDNVPSPDLTQYFITWSPTTADSVTLAPITRSPITSEPTASLVPTKLIETPLAYKPGLINTVENLLHLSEGLTSRIIARSGKKIVYSNGEKSNVRFHDWPDGGEVFVDPESADGGWILVSNSEEDIEGGGGVGALTFDGQGNVVKYNMILTGTTMNCNGGATHFGGWVSCEEDFWGSNGRCWLTDPTGRREAKPISLGADGGIFEAFAYDIRDPDNAHFFITEDDLNGAMQRWTPDSPDWDDPWNLLLGTGVTEYLVLQPNSNDHTHGSYSWVRKKRKAKENAGLYYPNSEGIAVSGSTMYFVCKKYSHIYELDLENMTYTRQSTQNELFDGGPDQIKKVLTGENSTLLYFTEDGGVKGGIHAKGADGVVHTILEGLYEPETTGLSFSPDGKRLYFSFQEDGIVFEIRRLDGEPFHGTTMNIKSHPEGSAEVPSRRKRRDRNLLT